MNTADNMALVRRFSASGPSNDHGERARFAHPDVVWHVPGENPVAGTYRGYDAVFREIGEKMQPLDVWQVDVVDGSSRVPVRKRRSHRRGVGVCR